MAFRRALAIMMSVALVAGLNPAAAMAEPYQAASITPQAAPTNLTAQYYEDIPEEMPNPSATLELNVPQRVTIEADGDVTWLAFTPAESGTYIIQSNRVSEKGDAYGALYKVTGDGLELVKADDDGGSNSDFLIKDDGFQQGSTYYIACSSYSGTVAYDVTAMAYDPYDLACMPSASSRWIWMGTEASTTSLQLVVITQVEDDEDEPTRIELAAGEDYDVEGWYSADGVTKLAAAPTASGRYMLRIEGIAPYTGTKDFFFTIMDRHDLEISWYTAYVKDAYTDNEITLDTLNPRVELCYTEDEDEQVYWLKRGEDFEVAAWEQYAADADQNWGWREIPSMPTTAGKYRAKITGAGEYYGTIYAEFTISNVTDINGYRVSVPGDLWTDGAAVTLSRLKLERRDDYSSKTISLGTDYAVKAWYEAVLGGDGDGYSYGPGELLSAAPTASGRYMAQIEGKGLYSGTTMVLVEVSATTDITAYDLTHNYDAGYDGTPLTPEKIGLKLSRTDPATGKETVLEYGRDYKIAEWSGDDASGTSLDQITSTGSYYVQLEGIAPYTGTKDFDIYVQDALDLNYAIVTGVSSHYYLGNEINIEPVVTSLAGAKLTKGVHYSVSVQRYDSDRDEYVEVGTITRAGDYSMQIKALDGSGYHGTYGASFTIHPAEDRTALTATDYKVTLASGAYSYSGSKITPKVTVKPTGYADELVEGTDYTVSYANNVNAGTATVTVTGIGAYTGTLTANFTINAAPLSTAKLSLRTPSGAYTGSTQSGTVASVALNGKTLKSGTDYTVSAASGAAAGKYLVTVNGKGNYYGKVTAYYEIVQAPIDSAVVTLKKSSAAYTGKSQTATVTGVKLGNVALASGTDYTVATAKTSKAAVGSYDVVVTGKGNYTGTAKATYSITKAANPMKLKATSKTLKASKKTKKLASKKTFTIAFSKKAQGKVTYTVAKAAKKRVTVTKAGKVTVKKGTPKGTYKITVKAAGNANYKKASAKTYKVIVK